MPSIYFFKTYIHRRLSSCTMYYKIICWFSAHNFFSIWPCRTHEKSAPLFPNNRRPFSLRHLHKLCPSPCCHWSTTGSIRHNESHPCTHPQLAACPFARTIGRTCPEGVPDERFSPTLSLRSRTMPCKCRYMAPFFSSHDRDHLSLFWVEARSA